MRQEYDEEADLLRVFYSDEPVALSRERVDGETRHIFHLDAKGKPVSIEVHGFSKMKEKFGEGARKEFKAKPGSTEVVGELDWAITECATGKTLGAGHRTILLEGFTIQTIEKPDGTLITRTFPLDQDFTVGLSSTIMPSASSSGFALQGLRTDLPSFSWDWFQADASGHAKKLQEQGELSFTMAQAGSMWQIKRMEFLTDVSLRILKFGANPSPADPDWRILVKAGSWVHWPLLVEGVVV